MRVSLEGPPLTHCCLSRGQKGWLPGVSVSGQMRPVPRSVAAQCREGPKPVKDAPDSCAMAVTPHPSPSIPATTLTASGATGSPCPRRTWKQTPPLWGCCPMPLLPSGSGVKSPGHRSPLGGRATTPRLRKSPACLVTSVSAAFGEGDGKVAPLKVGFRGEEGSQEDGRKAFLAEAKAGRQGFHRAFQEARPQC